MTDATVTPDAALAMDPATPAAPAAPATPEAATTATDVPDWAKDPAQALREVQKARQEAADARTKSRDAAQASARADLLKELGLVKDDQPADPKQAAADLATARTAATDAARELAIYRNAPAGTDIAGLLDSRAFMNSVGNIDPTDTTALVAAIGTAITSTPRLKTGQAPASSGTDLPGGQQAAPSFTREQLKDPAFYQANKTEIQAALRAGRIH